MAKVSRQKLLLLSFLVALSIRLALVIVFQSEPVYDLLWNDAVGWNLAQGTGFTASQAEPRIPGIYRPPGYPGFLALIYFLFGHSYFTVYVVQAVLDAFSCILLFLILSHYASSALAVLGAGLYAVYPYPGMFCAVLHQDILLVFTVLLVLWLLARASKAPERISNWLLLGASVGFAALVKGNMILIMAIPVIVAFSLFGKAAIKRVFFMIAVMMLVLLPWIIRNYMLFDAFPPLAVGGTGTNLAYVVHELKGGEDQLLRQLDHYFNQKDRDPWGPSNRQLKTFNDGAPLIESEKELTIGAVAYLKEHWPQYLWLTVKHVPRLWITKYSKWHGATVAAIGQALSWVVLGFGLAGMFLMRHQFRMLLPLYLAVILVTMIHAPYTPEARYTLPARPIMLFFVGAAMIAIATKSSTLSRHFSLKNSSLLQ